MARRKRERWSKKEIRYLKEYLRCWEKDSIAIGWDDLDKIMDIWDTLTREEQDRVSRYSSDFRSPQSRNEVVYP